MSLPRTITFAPTASTPHERRYRSSGRELVAERLQVLVSKPKLIKTFENLINIPSLGLKEGKMASHLEAKFRKLGFETFRDNAHLDEELRKQGAETGNLFASLKGEPNSPSLLFALHMDGFGKQQEGIVPTIIDGRMYPIGNTILKADNDAYKASLLHVLEIIKAQGLPHGDIHVIATIGEEKGLLGTSRIWPQNVTGDLAFSLDGDKLEEIIHGGVQISMFDCDVFGKAAHTIYSEKGINSNVIAVNALVACGFPVNGIIDQYTNTRMILGTINGGQGAGAVSAKTTVTGNVRGMLPSLVDETIAKIVNSLRTEAEKYGTSIEDRSFKACDRYDIPTSAPVVNFAKEALTLNGINPQLTTSLGGSDANPLNAKGSPMVLLGMDIQDEHIARDDERGVAGESLGIDSFIEFTRALLILTQLPTLYERVK